MGFIRNFLERPKPKVLGFDSDADFMRHADPLKAKLIGVDNPDPGSRAFNLDSGAFGEVTEPVDPVKTLIQPTAMPSPSGAGARDAKRRALRQQLARRGRLSTILTESDDSLGVAG